MKLPLAALSVILGAAVFAPSATASAWVSFHPDADGVGYLGVTTNWDGGSCVVCSSYPDLIVKRKGRSVFRRDWYAEYSSQKFFDFPLKCARTGRHTWTLRQLDRQRRALEVRRGSFKVKRCRKSQHRYASRYSAANRMGEWIDETRNYSYYILYTSCVQTGKRRGSWSDRWRCTATTKWQNRRCTQYGWIRFVKLRRFGRKANHAYVRLGREHGCRYI